MPDGTALPNERRTSCGEPSRLGDRNGRILQDMGMSIEIQCADVDRLKETGCCMHGSRGIRDVRRIGVGKSG